MSKRIKNMHLFCTIITVLCLIATLMAILLLYTREISFFEFWVMLLLTLLLMVLNALLMLKIETTFLQRRF